MPEKDIRYVMEVVDDANLLTYLSCFEELEEFEWCRVIREVMNERHKTQ